MNNSYPQRKRIVAFHWKVQLPSEEVSSGFPWGGWTTVNPQTVNRSFFSEKVQFFLRESKQQLSIAKLNSFPQRGWTIVLLFMQKVNTYSYSSEKVNNSFPWTLEKTNSFPQRVFFFAIVLLDNCAAVKDNFHCHCWNLIDSSKPVGARC